MSELSIFAISDLHLSFGADKPMNIFKGWENHTERLRANWQRLVSDGDTVVLPGDFSWALKLEDTKKDFEFLNALPGKKILLKGNHDLWWSTSKKLKEFLNENNFNSVDFIFNGTIVCEGFAIAGTRGWFFDDKADKKVLMREAGRLEMSLSAAEKTGLPVLTFLHYPCVWGDEVCSEIFEVLLRHGVKEVFHGHIHGAGIGKTKTEYGGIKFRLLSCDCVDFTPNFIA